MNVGIVGCGLIGNKRAKALAGAKLVAVTDINHERAQTLASNFPNVTIHKKWQELVCDKNIEIVVIATSNDTLLEITKAAIENKKHVLVEKPAARNFNELNQIEKLYKNAGVKIKVGFNHRFHPSLLKARELVNAGEIGEMMFIRGRYGHGGRLGYEKEWRANPKISGGGELLDQGVHLIDLSRMFLGNFNKVEGHAHTYYWNMPVDDNAFLSLQTSTGKTAWLQVSCSEWKNMFSLEIYGKTGKIQIDGLGGSYGTEKCTFYKMLPKMGPPDTMSWEYPGADNSWDLEFKSFLDSIKNNTTPDGDFYDALESLRIVETIYKGSNYDHN